MNTETQTENMTETQTVVETPVNAVNLPVEAVEDTGELTIPFVTNATVAETPAVEVTPPVANVVVETPTVETSGVETPAVQTVVKRGRKPGTKAKAEKKARRKGILGRPKTMQHLVRVVVGEDLKPVGRGRPTGDKFQVVYLPKGTRFNKAKYENWLVRFNKNQHKTYKSIPMDDWKTLIGKN